MEQAYVQWARVLMKWRGVWHPARHGQEEIELNDGGLGTFSWVAALGRQHQLAA